MSKELIVLLISAAHILYYLYIACAYRIMKIGTVTNTPHEEVFKLRSEFGVKIKTFQKSGWHLGYAWGRTIYLNEKLLNIKKKARYPYSSLRRIFYHEYYHLKHHVWKVIILRLVLSLIPLLMLVPWNALAMVLIAAMVYCNYALLMSSIINKTFETQANNYADKMLKEWQQK